MSRFLVPVLVAFAIVAPPALAQREMPTRFMQGIPQEKGQWRMEFLEGGPARAGKMAAMRTCRDPRDGFEHERADGKAGDRCQTKVLKDTSAAAQMEVSCSGRKPMTIDMTRESDKSYVVTMSRFVDEEKGGGPMKIRYTYEGACSEGTRSNAITFDKSSPQCQQMANAMAQMDPAKQCASRPAGERAACESAMRARVEQMKGMCQ